MNANQLITMITRMIVRKVMRYGVNAGMNAMSKSDSAGRGQPHGKQKQGGQKQPGQQGTTKSARQAMRMARRASRF